MEFKPIRLLNLIYFILCLFATIFLSVYSILRYLKNEDAIFIKTSTFLASNDAIYPSFTLCIKSPFLDEKFDIHRNDSINATMYRGFLEGKYWHERFLKVDYDYVTVSMSENLIDSFYRTHMNKFIHWTPDHYVSFRTSYEKCFTINAPASEKHPIRYTNLKIKNKIFPNGARSSENRILTYIHYPGQRLAATLTQKYDFTPRRNKNINFRMIFRVRNMDVITRRNKIHEPCLENWKYFDQSFMENMINENGCHPPYWKISSSMPICKETEEMKNFTFSKIQKSLTSFMPPCRVIDRLDYTNREENLNDHDKSLRNRPRNDSFFDVVLEFLQTDFNEKIKTRAYTLDDLIGSCGGYIGLFLGYALIQFPEFIKHMFHGMKSGINTFRQIMKLDNERDQN